MNTDSLKRSLEAAYFYHAQMLSPVPSAYEQLQAERKQVIVRIYHEMSELEAQLVNVEESFGYYHKAGFNPNQPRVPAGSPEGGQWTSGGSFAGAEDEDTESEGTEDILEKITVRDPRGRLWDRSTIFIGGADDQRGLFSDHPVRNSNSLNKNIYGTNYYSPYDDPSKINTQIAKIPAGRRINLVGHSYGGDTAADIAIANPGRIHTLITVDPVSWMRPDFGKVRDSVHTWINIYSIGRPGTPMWQAWRNGNLVAGIGGSWDDITAGYATATIAASVNHGEFDSSLQTIIGSRTAEQILNSR